MNVLESTMGFYSIIKEADLGDYAGNLPQSANNALSYLPGFDSFKRMTGRATAGHYMDNHSMGDLAGKAMGMGGNSFKPQQAAANDPTLGPKFDTNKYQPQRPVGIHRNLVNNLSTQAKDVALNDKPFLEGVNQTVGNRTYGLGHVNPGGGIGLTPGNFDFKRLWHDHPVGVGLGIGAGALGLGYLANKLFSNNQPQVPQTTQPNHNMIYQKYNG